MFWSFQKIVTVYHDEQKQQLSYLSPILVFVLKKYQSSEMYVISSRNRFLAEIISFEAPLQQGFLFLQFWLLSV